MKYPYTQFVVYKQAVGEWHGNDRLGEVKIVTVRFLVDGPNIFRIAVWGNDDFGLEKEFETDDGAVECFLDIISEKYISEGYLRDLGFLTA